MNLVYNNVDRNITGKVITRRGNQRGNYDVELQANEVTLSTGKKFVNKVLREILLGTNNIAEYNLTYKHDETEDLMSCFALDTAEQKNWYVYNRALGLLKTSPTKIDTLLKGGWHTNSRTLPVLLEESQAKVK